MAIVSGELHVRGSTTAGAAGNANAFGAAGTALGKYICNNDTVDNTLNNLFPDATGAENAASNVDYQCFFVYNANGAAITWQNVIVYISSQVSGGADYAIGVDTTAASALAAAPAQALTIANKNTAPAGVAFSAPTSAATGLAVGNVPAGQVKAIWLRRTCSNSAAANSDGASLIVQGDTVA